MDPVMKICLFIMGGVFIFVMVFALIKDLILSKYKFVCFKCNEEFHPKWN